MLSATSFQITLLSGRNGQDNYVLGGVFLAATAFWYPMFRWKPSAWALSLPWIFFGLAFLLIGVPSVHPSLAPVHWVLSNVATWCYAVASAAGFLFFSLNFGEEAVCFSFTNPSLEYFLIPYRALLQRSGRSERV
jgi:alpha-1,3-glucan synthase